MPEETWLVCHTRPRCEKKFAALMRAEKFEHYLPLVPTVRRLAGRARTFTKPLFPGYVFALVPDDRRPRIYQQDLLARAITVTDLPSFLRQLDEVKRVVGSGLELTVMPLLARGRRVRIVGGPLHGLEGCVEDPTRPDNVVIAVDVLQQGLMVKVSASHLHPLP